MAGKRQRIRQDRRRHDGNGRRALFRHARADRGKTEVVMPCGAAVADVHARRARAAKSCPRNRPWPTWARQQSRFNPEILPLFWKSGRQSGPGEADKKK